MFLGGEGDIHGGSIAIVFFVAEGALYRAGFSQADGDFLVSDLAPENIVKNFLLHLNFLLNGRYRCLAPGLRDIIAKSGKLYPGICLLAPVLSHLRRAG